MPENTNQSKLSNYSINFDGAATTTINVGNMTAIQGASTFSISAWINLDSTGQQRIFGSWNASANKRLAGFGIHSDNKLLLQISSNGSGFDQLFSTSTITTINTWTHVAVTFSSGTAEFYIDGASAGTDTSTTTSIYDVSSDYFIGSFQTSTTVPFDGKMDQVCIFDYALSTDQITYLYNLNNPMAITGAKPIAYYPIGDNSNPTALAGYPNAAVEGSVFDFDGTNQFLEVPFSSDLRLTNVDFTISFWTKPSATGRYIMLENYNPTAAWGVFNDNGAVEFYNSSGWLVTGTTIPNNVWTHIALVGDIGATNLKVYKNGAEDSSNTSSLVTVDATGPLTICAQRNGAGNFDYDGNLSNLSIWSGTALSASQITEIYNNGAPNDISSLNPTAWWKLNGAEDTFDGSNWTIKDFGSGGNDGTSSGMTSANLIQSDLYRTTPYSNYSINFDRAGSDKMSTPAGSNGILSGATSCSVSVWFNLTTTTLGTPGLQPFVTSWVNPNYNYIYRWYDGDLQFFIRHGSSTTSASYTWTPTQDVWYHTVGTYDGSTIRLYLDGIQVATASASGTIPTITTSDNIGIYASVYFMDGPLSNIAYWKNTTLTQSEITEIYNAGVPTDLSTFSGTAPSVWYPMDGKKTYYRGDVIVARDAIGTRDMIGSNLIQENIIGNAPGSSSNGTGVNIDITDLKGDMSGSTKNSYSINMADYGDPNSQGVTPADSGRTTSVPG